MQFAIRLARWRPGKQQKPANVLGDLGEVVFRSVDVAAVSTELNDFTQQKKIFDYNVETFQPCDPRYYRNQSVTLEEQLREALRERSAWLRNTDRSIRDLLNQYGTIIGAQENLRLQKSVKWLTVIIAILTVLMLFVPFVCGPGPSLDSRSAAQKVRTGI